MRAVWVVEWQHPAGSWHVWHDDSIRQDVRGAWASMRKARSGYPDDNFRVVKYVPAPAKKPAKKRSAP